MRLYVCMKLVTSVFKKCSFKMQNEEEDSGWNDSILILVEMKAYLHSKQTSFLEWHVPQDVSMHVIGQGNLPATRKIISKHVCFSVIIFQNGVQFI